MTQTNRVVIVGGHGKIALLAASKLQAVNYAVDSVIRNPEHSDDVRAAGGNPVVLDIEMAGIGELASAFSGADAVVFSAGAGGGNPQRTHAVDFEAATRAMAAAEQAGVKRFIMVSYANAAVDVHRLDPGNSFYPYAKAKHDADAKLRESTLDYTILGPGLLTLEPATGKIVRTEEVGDAWPDDKRVTSRESVAELKSAAYWSACARAFINTSALRIAADIFFFTQPRFCVPATSTTSVLKPRSATLV